MRGRRARSFAPDVLRRLVLAQRDEPAVPEMVVRRPFHEFELTHQCWLQPATIDHLRLRQSLTPPAAPGLRKIGEWAPGNLQSRKLLEQLIARGRCESVPGTCRVDEPIAFVVTNDHRVEGLRADCVSGD